jgi:hypothetical protein
MTLLSWPQRSSFPVRLGYLVRLRHRRGSKVGAWHETTGQLRAIIAADNTPLRLLKAAQGLRAQHVEGGGRAIIVLTDSRGPYCLGLLGVSRETLGLFHDG